MSARLPESVTNKPVVATAAPTDDEIFEAIQSLNTAMTYVIRKVLERRHRHLQTPWVLRRLIRLEKRGKVERVPSHYERQICWRVVPAAPQSASNNASSLSTTL
jgi:hypothetical protein